MIQVINFLNKCPAWAWQSSLKANSTHKQVFLTVASVKFLEETDVPVHSFLEVTAVRYKEKPVKDDDIRDDIRDIMMIRRNVLCLTVRLNQPAGGRIDCTIHVPHMSNLFPRMSIFSVLRDFKTYLRSDMQIPAVTT